MGRGQNRTKFPPGFWEEHKDEIIDMYINQQKTSTEIGKLYGCYGTTICTYLHQWGIQIRNTATDRYNALHNVDVHYLDNIDTEHKAYWVGYIFADGCISKNKQLVFGCHRQDIDILEKLKLDFSCDYPIRTNKDGNPVMSICSKHIGQTLFDMGFTNNKSYEVDFAKIITYIPDKLMHHFVRGMFDGDGSIRYYNYDYAKGYQYHFGYTGLKEVCEFVAKFLKLKTKIIQERDTNTYTLKTANAPMIKYIYSVLYKDATVYCERKYKTFQEVLKLIHEENKDRVKGVHWDIASQKWKAVCEMNDTKVDIGYFIDKHDAEIARLQYEYDTYGWDSMQWYLYDEYGITTPSNCEVII